jgi:hypothetical protein
MDRLAAVVPTIAPAAPPAFGPWVVRAVVALVRRPRLWPTALRQVWRLAPTGWWRRPPFLPLPDREYLGFRMQTMYGDASRAPEPGDVVTYLEWCRRWPAATADRG